MFVTRIPEPEEALELTDADPYPKPKVSTS
jgi:hypothetical protein